MNIPFFCVFLAYLSVYVPKFAIARSQARLPGGYDNNNPRDQLAKLDEEGRRGLAAHNNAFESFPMFAAAVILATLAKVPLDTVEPLCAVHVVARYLYPFAYIAGKGSLRSAIWGIGFFAAMALFVLAFTA